MSRRLARFKKYTLPTIGWASGIGQMGHLFWHIFCENDREGMLSGSPMFCDLYATRMNYRYVRVWISGSSAVHSLPLRSSSRLVSLLERPQGRYVIIE